MTSRRDRKIVDAAKFSRMRYTRLRRRLPVRRRNITLVVAGFVVFGIIAIAPSTPGWAMRQFADVIADGTGVVREALRRDVADEALMGPARIIDGDTLEVRGSRVRLYGIDAPESAQRCRAGGRVWACGRAATRALARRIGSRPVACTERDRDPYGRVVAVCQVGGVDVNAWMVAAGWAFAYRKYSMQYVKEEMAAKAARRGVWRGDVVSPWDWRRVKRLVDAGTAVKRAGRCRIKGNISISRGGERIYHVPGGEFYDQTRINTSRGERWFCSEAEARAAGWRRARR